MKVFCEFWTGAEQTTVYHLTPPHKHLPLQRCSRSHAPSVAFSGVDVWLLRFPLFWAFLVFLFPDSKGDIAHLYTACVVCNYHSWGSSGVFSEREVCVFSSSVYVLGCYVSNVKRDTNPRTAGFTPEFILRSFQLGMVFKTTPRAKAQRSNLFTERLRTARTKAACVMWVLFDAMTKENTALMLIFLFLTVFLACSTVARMWRHHVCSLLRFSAPFSVFLLKFYLFMLLNRMLLLSVFRFKAFV